MKTSCYWLLALVFLVAGCAEQEKTGTTAPESHAGTGALQHDGSGAPTALGPLDVRYVTEDFTTAIVLHPARLLNSPVVKALKDVGAPVDAQLTEFKENSGLDPYNIEQVIVLLDKNTAEMAPMMLGLPGFGPPGGGFENEPDLGPVPVIEKQPLEKLEEEKPESDAAAGDDTSSALIPADRHKLQFVNTLAQPAEEAIPDGFAEGGDHGGFDQMGPPIPTVIVRFVNPVDQEAVFSHAPFPLQDIEVDGLKAKALPGGVCHFADERTLIATTNKMLKKVVSAKDVDSPLTRQLKAADAQLDVIVVADLKPFAKELFQASGMLTGLLGNNPELKALAPIPSQLKAVSLGFGVTSKNLIELNLVLDSAENATNASTALTKSLEQGRTQYEQTKPMLQGMIQLEDAAAREKVMAMSDGVVSGLAASSDGPTLKIAIPQPNDVAGLIALLKPEIEKAQQAAKDAEKKNNLKQIGLGFHNYHDVYDAFPGAGSDAEGQQQGLSWRVHILPMLDEYELYNEFNLDEPWDSDHNKALIAKMPKVFQTPGTTEEGKTSLHVYVGERAFALDKGMKIREMTDGTSNTILVVQAGADKADIWTKPGGLNADAEDPLAELGTIDGASFLALFGDGSVRAIKLDVALETLKALITKDGGEVIDYNSF